MPNVSNIPSQLLDELTFIGATPVYYAKHKIMGLHAWADQLAQYDMAPGKVKAMHEAFRLTFDHNGKRYSVLIRSSDLTILTRVAFNLYVRLPSGNPCPCSENPVSFTQYISTVLSLPQPGADV